MNSKFRWGIIIVLIMVSLYYIFPLDKKIKLGLDLQGGMHVILGVQVDAAVDAKLTNTLTQLKKEFNASKIKFTYIKKIGDSKIDIALPEDFIGEARKIIEKNYPYLRETGLDKNNNIMQLMFTQDEIKRTENYAVEQAIQVVRNRIDQFGVSEPLIQKQGETQILIQLPGINDPDRAIDLIGKTAQLRFHIVDENINPRDALDGDLPFDDIILYEQVFDETRTKIIQKIPYVLKSDAVLTGEYLVDAGVRISPQYNEPYVSIRFDSAGAKLFDEITADNVGKRLAIVLDDHVYSAPSIRERISGGEAQITGNFTMEEAKDLAIVLRAGSLPAPVEILENRTVGPSLGLDSINSGVKAAMIGVILVMLFMAIYYRVAGLFSVFALLLNFIFILAAMSLFGATLTLPGIAGLILIIGMSVDANVLIFERIREEIRLGRTPVNAIESGYERAMSTILDANITTLIAAVVLFQFGTGPIKGFAVTLSIGIIASLFTAIFVTRTIFISLYLNKKLERVNI